MKDNETYWYMQKLVNIIEKISEKTTYAVVVE